MQWSFMRFFRRPSTSSRASTILKNSALAEDGASEWIKALDRKSTKYSLYEVIAAIGVIAAILWEDWDEFGKLVIHHDWSVLNKAVGGFLVAVFIALEVHFSRVGHSADGKVKDWMRGRVAELNLAAEKERLKRVAMELRLRRANNRMFDREEEAAVRSAVAPFSGQRFSIYYASPVLVNFSEPNSSQKCSTTSSLTLDGSTISVTKKTLAHFFYPK